MPVNTIKLSASHSHNLLNQNRSTKELGQGDIILKSIIFEVSLSFAVLKNPGVGQMRLTLRPNPNLNLISDFISSSRKRTGRDALIQTGYFLRTSCVDLLDIPRRITQQNRILRANDSYMQI